jgi:Protein of unknown function (DUF1570)
MALVLFLGLVLPAQTPQADSAKLARAIHDEYRAAMEAERKGLAAIADRLEKPDEAATVRALIEPEDVPGPTRFRPLPEYVPAAGAGGLANVPIEKPPVLPDEAKALRSRTAKTLFTLAGRAASKPVRRLALADKCLRGVLERDPNHAEARRLMGFLPYKGGWATPHAVSLMTTGHVLHYKFGWVQADWVPHLDAGELPGDFTASGKARNWIPADEADALHREWSQAWKIDTAPHFAVEANVPLVEAVAFARRLEAFYELFLSQFADVIGAENLPLARRFDNKGQQPVATPKKFAVSYFATKEQYVGFLAAKFGLNEDVSLGYYMPLQEARRHNTTPRSYFFKDDTNPIAAHATLYHEASHQILFESAGKSSYDTNRTNFWIWEGLGTYFETVEPQGDGTILVGGLVGPRIEQARLRVERDDYVPLGKFAAMDKEKFWEDRKEGIFRNYAQSMALAVFLLHGEDGKYREAFLDYVASAYRGKVKASSLADRLGVPFATLDKEFRAYLK